MATLNVIKWPFEATVAGFLTSLADIWRLWRLEIKSAKLAKKLERRMKEVKTGFQPFTANINPLFASIICWLGENGVHSTNGQDKKIVRLMFDFTVCRQSINGSGTAQITTTYTCSGTNHEAVLRIYVDPSCEMDQVRLRYEITKLIARAVEEAKHPDSPNF